MLKTMVLWYSHAENNGTFAHLPHIFGGETLFTYNTKKDKAPGSNLPSLAIIL
jgi:hypothetical protein